MYKKNKAFTLVELAIVIVIIGLIVAGVVAGQNIIKAAQLRSIAQDMSKYASAIQTFRLQYDYLPGDLPTAYDFWGNTCSTTVINCNGNGDFVVNYTAPTGETDSDDNRESIRTWQHMGLAEVLPRTFLGTGNGNSGESSLPFSTNKQGKFAIETQDGATVLFGINTGRQRQNLTVLYGGRAFWWNSALTVLQAKDIDSKLDDGVANKGKIFGGSGNDVAGSACSATLATAGGADYNAANLSSSTKSCVLLLRVM